MKLDLETPDGTQVESILERLGSAPGMGTVLSYARSQLETGALFDNTSGAYLFGPNPSVAPFAFHLVVFPGLSESQIENYERRMSVQLPPSYRSALR